MTTSTRKKVKRVVKPEPVQEQPVLVNKRKPVIIVQKEEKLDLTWDSLYDSLEDVYGIYDKG